MDIGFIEEKDRDKIFQLMEICGIDMNQAYQLYNNANKNVETATKMYLQQNGQNNNQYSENIPQATNPFYYQQELSDFDLQYQKYKQFKESGITFENRYQVRKQGVINNFFTKIWSGKQQKSYKHKIEQYFGNKVCSIKFSDKSLSYTLYKSQKLPIIIYIFDFKASLKNKIYQILHHQSFQLMVNVQFLNFGLDKNYQMEPLIAQVIKPYISNNSLLILRINVYQEIQTISKIAINQSTQVGQIMQELKKTKSKCINKQLEEGYLQERYRQQMMGNYNYVKPITPMQRGQIKKERELKKKQQKQFYDSMAADEAKQKSKLEEQKKKKSQFKSNLQQQKKQQQNVKPVPQKRDMTQQRKKIRDHLKIYTEGMTIKLRFPNGESQLLTVSKDETPNYIYNYIKGIDKDIGFQNDANRKFYVIRPYDKLNLSENLNKTLNIIFEGSCGENLVVNQIIPN